VSTKRSVRHTSGIAPSIIGTPEPPAVLARSIEEAISAMGTGESLATATPDTLLGAAELLFRETLKSGCTSRSSAVALLVVDALVTYAFERASDDPARIEERAARAMASLAALTDLAQPSS
jgi:hypothetical protein